MKIHPVFVYIIASVVIALWVANFIAGIFVEGYNPDPTIGGAVLLVLGAIIGAISKGGNGHNKPRHRQNQEQGEGEIGDGS